MCRFVSKTRMIPCLLISMILFFTLFALGCKNDASTPPKNELSGKTFYTCSEFDVVCQKFYNDSFTKDIYYNGVLQDTINYVFEISDNNIHNSSLENHTDTIDYEYYSDTDTLNTGSGWFSYTRTAGTAGTIDGTWSCTKDV